MATQINLNGTVPAAPSNGQNVLWQNDASSPINVSAYVNLNSTPNQLLFNSGGVLGGSSNLTWNNTNQSLAVVAKDLNNAIFVDASGQTSSGSRAMQFKCASGPLGVISFINTSSSNEVALEYSPSSGAFTINVDAGVGELLVTSSELEFSSTAGSGYFRLNNTGTGTGNFEILMDPGIISEYGIFTTAGAGVPPIVAKSNLTAQSSAITATTVFAVPSGGSGLYRISYRAAITTAATASSSLGGTNGFQAKYTDVNDSVVKTSNPTTPVVSAGNTTATTISGVLYANCKASTNLQYLFDYTSSGITTMVYDLDIYVEYLG